jgi:hypothetical protein
MSTIKRRRRSSRLSLSPYRRHELLGGRVTYPVRGYDGYGDGTSTDVAQFISDEMKADWKANREVLLEFWRSGKSEAEVFPDDCLPWLYTYRKPDTLPWAEMHLMD